MCQPFLRVRKGPTSLPKLGSPDFCRTEKGPQKKKKVSSQSRFGKTTLFSAVYSSASINSFPAFIARWQSLAHTHTHRQRQSGLPDREISLRISLKPKATAQGSYLHTCSPLPDPFRPRHPEDSQRPSDPHFHPPLASIPNSISPIPQSPSFRHAQRLERAPSGEELLGGKGNGGVYVAPYLTLLLALLKRDIILRGVYIRKGPRNPNPTAVLCFRFGL